MAVSDVVTGTSQAPSTASHSLQTSLLNGMEGQSILEHTTVSKVKFFGAFVFGALIGSVPILAKLTNPVNILPGTGLLFPISLIFCQKLSEKLLIAKEEGNREKVEVSACGVAEFAIYTAALAGALGGAMTGSCV